MGRLNILVLGLAACTGGAPVVHVEVSATCSDTRGTAEVRRAGRPYWEPLQRGATLRNGDWVRTREQATAHVELLAGGRLDLLERAVVVIEPPAEPGAPVVAAKGPRVAVEEGEVRATVAAADPPLEVRRRGLPPAVLDTPAVYRVVATDAGVEVARVDSDPVVPDIESPKYIEGSKAGPPKEFPASVAPGIDARVKFDPRGSLKLTWSAVPGAKAYRVQTARDWSFTVEKQSADVEGTSWLMKPEDLGLYVWRVAAVGANGKAGEFGYARRLFIEAETPKDLLVAPEDGASASQESVLFSWETVGNEASYRLMVSKGPDPQRAPIINQVINATHARVEMLPPGNYHWGVYTEGSVLRPLFLKPRKLAVKTAMKK